jgi:hypothetical protein
MIGIVRYGTVRIRGQPIRGSVLKKKKIRVWMVIYNNFEFLLVGYILVFKKKLRR